MASVEIISVEDLRQDLPEVNDTDVTKWLMAAITYKETDDPTQADAEVPDDGGSNGSTEKEFSAEETTLPRVIEPNRRGDLRVVLVDSRF